LIVERLIVELLIADDAGTLWSLAFGAATGRPFQSSPFVVRPVLVAPLVVAPVLVCSLRAVCQAAPGSGRGNVREL